MASRWLQQAGFAEGNDALTFHRYFASKLLILDVLMGVVWLMMGIIHVGSRLEATALGCYPMQEWPQTLFSSSASGVSAPYKALSSPIMDKGTQSSHDRNKGSSVLKVPLQSAACTARDKTSQHVVTYQCTSEESVYPCRGSAYTKLAYAWRHGAEMATTLADDPVSPLVLPPTAWFALLVLPLLFLAVHMYLASLVRYDTTVQQATACETSSAKVPPVKPLGSTSAHDARQSSATQRSERSGQSLTGNRPAAADATSSASITHIALARIPEWLPLARNVASATIKIVALVLPLLVQLQSTLPRELIPLQMSYAYSSASGGFAGLSIIPDVLVLVSPCRC